MESLGERRKGVTSINGRLANELPSAKNVDSQFLVLPELVAKKVGKETEELNVWQCLEGFADKLKSLVENYDPLRSLAELSLAVGVKVDKAIPVIPEPKLNLLMLKLEEDKSPLQQFIDSLRKMYLFINPFNISRRLVELFKGNKNGAGTVTSSHIKNVIRQLSDGDESSAQILTEAVEQAIKLESCINRKTSILVDDIFSGPIDLLFPTLENQTVAQDKDVQSSAKNRSQLKEFERKAFVGSGLESLKIVFDPMPNFH